MKILDCTHVLAAVRGAISSQCWGRWIKVEDPNEPDQSREAAPTPRSTRQAWARASHNRLEQATRSRSISKPKAGAGVKRLVRDWADVLVENYRPGSFRALGMGYEDLAQLKPKLIYASMTAFGQDGPRGNMTAYDHAIQSTSGITASTGTETSGPIKVGAPVIDYATGTMGAFAISAALYQSLRTGKGQYIDMAMLDVALILQATHITDYLHNGHHAKRAGNRMRYPETRCTMQRGLLHCGSNRRQHRRFYVPSKSREAARCAAESARRYDEKRTLIGGRSRPNSRRGGLHAGKHVPETSVRELRERWRIRSRARRSAARLAACPASATRDRPLAAFKYAHGGPSLERPPPVSASTTMNSCVRGSSAADWRAAQSGAAA